MATAQTLLLQHPTLQGKTHLPYHSPHFPAHVSFAHVNIRQTSKKLSLKCFLPNNNDGSVADHHFNKNAVGKRETKQNPVEIVAKTIMNVLKALQKPAAVAVVAGLLLMLYPKLALAGGSMGGSCFSSDSDWSSDDEGGVSVSSERSSSAGVGSFMFFVALVLLSGLAKSSENSVLKLQVGLFGLKRSLQEDLNRIAETADMSTREGLHYVLTETVKALLRHPHYCISACLSVDVKYGKEETERRFNQLSIEERGKFDEETLVNINNIKNRSSTIPKASGSSNEYMVITILVAAKGGYKPASIDNIKDLTKVLQELVSIPSSETLAVHVIWTPQKEDETLSEQELLEDYPLLRHFQEMKTD